MLWRILGHSGTFWNILACFETVWGVLKCSWMFLERSRNAISRYGMYSIMKFNVWTCQRVDRFTYQRVDASTRWHVDVLMRWRVNASMLRHVETSSCWRVNPSMCPRCDALTRWRIDRTCNSKHAMLYHLGYMNGHSCISVLFLEPQKVIPLYDRVVLKNCGRWTWFQFRRVDASTATCANKFVMLYLLG